MPRGGFSLPRFWACHAGLLPPAPVHRPRRRAVLGVGFRLPVGPSRRPGHAHQRERVLDGQVVAVGGDALDPRPQQPPSLVDRAALDHGAEIGHPACDVRLLDEEQRLGPGLGQRRDLPVEGFLLSAHLLDARGEAGGRDAAGLHRLVEVVEPPVQLGELPLEHRTLALGLGLLRPQGRLDLVDQVAKHARVDRTVAKRVQHDPLDLALLEVAGGGAGLGTLLLLRLAGVILVGVVASAVPDVGLAAGTADQQPGQQVAAVRRAGVGHGRAPLRDHGPDPGEVLGTDERLVGVLDA